MDSIYFVFAGLLVTYIAFLIKVFFIDKEKPVKTTPQETPSPHIPNAPINAPWLRPTRASEGEVTNLELHFIHYPVVVVFHESEYELDTLCSMFYQRMKRYKWIELDYDIRYCTDIGYYAIIKNPELK